jgi:hypothetical protein
MSAVARLVTHVDYDGTDRTSVSARLEAELSNGRRVLLLDDRGWSGSGNIEDGGLEQIETTARAVVGPDEPPDGESYAHMEASHWATLAETLRRAGVDVDGSALRQLPHDVVLSDRLLARVGGDPG